MVVLGTVQGLEHPLHQILNWIVSRGVKPIIDPGSPLADEPLVHFMSCLILLVLVQPRTHHLLSFLLLLWTLLVLAISGECFQPALLQYINNKKIWQKMICICIYTCLSNYEYYNKSEIHCFDDCVCFSLFQTLEDCNLNVLSRW